jgi:hypothetical protein
MPQVWSQRPSLWNLQYTVRKARRKADTSTWWGFTRAHLSRQPEPRNSGEVGDSRYSGWAAQLRSTCG